ncbi:MAG: glycyl-radical enzyme activating protein [Spirochaetales bacterium]|nr:glycyl-radical enzyme activating protein [Spirochaetales bacterium]
MKQALITNIQRFSLNDGPGIRSTVFFQGCNMHCTWCHNPETISMKPVLMHYQNKCIGCGRCFSLSNPPEANRIENGCHVIDRKKLKNAQELADNCQASALVMSSRPYTVDEVMSEVVQDKLYYDLSGGGVTVSGGESTLYAPFVSELADACHEKEIKIACETNMALPWQKIEGMLKKMDLIMCDIKHVDSPTHKRYTGMDNQIIFNNVGRASLLGIPMIVRTPLIPGVTNDITNLKQIAEFLSKLNNIECYELLNFNPLGSSKRVAMAADDPFEDARPYSAKDLAVLRDELSESGVRIKIS